jgi:hypothetical protein
MGHVLLRRAIARSALCVSFLNWQCISRQQPRFLLRHATNQGQEAVQEDGVDWHPSVGRGGLRYGLGPPVDMSSLQSSVRDWENVACSM